MNKPSAVLCYVKCRESFIVILYFVDISEKRKKTKKQKKGQVYKSGDLVALSMVDCDSMEAGSIETILVKDNQVYFICKVHNVIVIDCNILSPRVVILLTDLYILKASQIISLL